MIHFHEPGCLELEPLRDRTSATVFCKRIRRIELRLSRWQRDRLPLHHIRKSRESHSPTSRTLQLADAQEVSLVATHVGARMTWKSPVQESNLSTDVRSVRSSFGGQGLGSWQFASCISRVKAGLYYRHLSYRRAGRLGIEPRSFGLRGRHLSI